jgi:hypothetical protein
MTSTRSTHFTIIPVWLRPEVAQANNENAPSVYSALLPGFEPPSREHKAGVLTTGSSPSSHAILSHFHTVSVLTADVFEIHNHTGVNIT